MNSINSEDQYTMAYIEIKNYAGRTWKIDGSPFNDWVAGKSDWFVVPEEFSFRSKLERKFWS